MRWIAAILVFLGVLTATVVVFSVLGLDGPWGALGTVIAIAASVAVFRGMKKTPAPKGEGLQ
jgi:peptidoglycan/LPS O-acetylase OafA/YrhL